MRAFAPVSVHRTLSIMPTRRCTAACQDCGTFSSPAVRERLTLNQILAAVQQAADAVYEVVVFTGGEATLVGSDLLAGIATASAKGLVTRLVTNAFWAKTRQSAERMMRRFVDAGLFEINYSTGGQHVRFVPLENIINATEAAVRAKLNSVSIMVETVQTRTITKESVTERADFQRLMAENRHTRINVLESPWMPLDPATVESYPLGLAANKQNFRTRSGCDSILSTTTVESDGTIGACCGLGLSSVPELHVGSIDTSTLADADQVASQDLVKRWIRLEGPEQIIAWASERDPTLAWEGMYAHRCQACMRLYKDPKIRKVIREHHREKLVDIMLGEYLLFGFDDESAVQEDISTLTV